MYREIRVDDVSIQEVVIANPLDDYELLDFGHGRKLERFDAYTVGRPDRRAQGEPHAGPWRADWSFGVYGSSAGA